jgi:hypothetical protein
METIKLIDGTYSGIEAAEILLSVIDDKIRFHEVKKFSFSIRFGIDSVESVKRLKELKEDRKKITTIIEKQKDNNVEFTISSSINITVKELA